jgi:hypothetical protein
MLLAQRGTKGLPIRFSSVANIGPYTARVAHEVAFITLTEHFPRREYAQGSDSISAASSLVSEYYQGIVLIALTDSHGVIANGLDGCTVVHRSLHELTVITDLLFRQWATRICLWCDTLTLFERFDQASWKNVWQNLICRSSLRKQLQPRPRPKYQPTSTTKEALVVALAHVRPSSLTFSMRRKMAKPILSLKLRPPTGRYHDDGLTIRPARIATAIINRFCDVFPPHNVLSRQ